MVENRPGAGGKIGTEVVARSPADGYTLLLGSKDTHGVLVYLCPGWDVDPMRDFAPIAMLIRIQNALVANPAFPASKPSELAAASKAAPKGVTCASPGVGTDRSERPRSIVSGWRRCSPIARSISRSSLRR